jgi:hypothetical protein
MKSLLTFLVFVDCLLAIKLGLIETEPKLVAICQKAIADAKAANQCDQSVV